VADTKLKRKPHPKHVLQLALYSDLLAEVQGIAPEHAHVELGDGTRATIRLEEVSAYARRVRGRLEAFVAEPEPTRPVPCADCPLCRWREVCATQLADEDSLFRVANITRGQVTKLEAAGVTTMAALAARTEPVRGMAPETLARLVTQAGLQVRREADGPAFALRPRLPGKGFDLLPAPDPGDVFYDIEGDPHVEGGLEYLHGLWAPDLGFRAIWAHDRDAERAALVAVLDAFRTRIDAHPGARIYHYASYEVTALRRLTALHGVGEAFLDRLLRERRFVDLYAVVRGGVLASEADYSIKSLEAFTGIERAGEVKTAGGSVVAYERWLEERDDAILAEIEDYNRIDCVSTEKLRDWLVAIRPAGPWPTLAPARGDDEAEEDAEAAALKAELAGSGLDPERQRLLFDLGFFHRREAKPAWWAIFDSLGRDTDELIDDLDCLGGLEAIGPARTEGRSIVRAASGWRTPKPRAWRGSMPSALWRGSWRTGSGPISAADGASPTLT
jgi:predicted RecB family nuclease